MATLSIAVLVATGAVILRSRVTKEPDTRAVITVDSQQRNPRVQPTVSDADLQRAADSLLAATNPELPENKYFTEFARDKLRWMVRESAAGRLTVAFVIDTAGGDLPPEVMMAATRLDGQPTIFIAKPRFARFLSEGGRTTPPFSQQQKNDFSVALIHETVHLLGWAGPPPTREQRAQEESRAWRDVTLGVVRPWRAANQPLHHRLIQVDDAFLSCDDAIPCPAIALLVRLTQ